MGARVDLIQSDSPASGGQLHENDILTAIDGSPIADSDAFVQMIGGAPINRSVQIALVRDGKPTTVAISLKKRQMPVAAVTHDRQRLRWGGMILGVHAPGEGLMVF